MHPKLIQQQASPDTNYLMHLHITICTCIHMYLMHLHTMRIRCLPFTSSGPYVPCVCDVVDCLVSESLGAIMYYTLLTDEARTLRVGNRNDLPQHWPRCSILQDVRGNLHVYTYFGNPKTYKDMGELGPNKFYTTKKDGPLMKITTPFQLNAGGSVNTR